MPEPSAPQPSTTDPDVEWLREIACDHEHSARFWEHATIDDDEQRNAARYLATSQRYERIAARLLLAEEDRRDALRWREVRDAFYFTVSEDGEPVALLGFTEDELPEAATEQVMDDSGYSNEAAAPFIESMIDGRLSRPQRTQGDTP